LKGLKAGPMLLEAFTDGKFGNGNIAGPDGKVVEAGVFEPPKGASGTMAPGFDEPGGNTANADDPGVEEAGKPANKFCTVGVGVVLVGGKKSKTPPLPDVDELELLFVVDVVVVLLGGTAAPRPGPCVCGLKFTKRFTGGGNGFACGTGIGGADWINP
jgi:hypothetical protein